MAGGIFANFDESTNILDDDEFNYDEFDEMCAIALLSRQPDEVIREFVNSEECAQLIAEGKLNRKTIMKLNKSNDLTRRETLAAYSLAKAKHDPLWEKFIKYKSLANDFKHQIIEKYKGKSQTVAKKSQRTFVSGKGTTASVAAAIKNTRASEVAAGSAGRI